VGRLDWDAEGALLVTNDGALANHLMHPRYQVARTYLAKVKGVPDGPTLQKLRDGVALEDGMAKPEHVEIQQDTPKNTWLKIVVTEGRNHLIKRMCAAIGHPVVRLFRAQYAGIGVEGLQPGRWRLLHPTEIGTLRAGSLAGAVHAPARMPARRHRASPKPSVGPGAAGSRGQGRASTRTRGGGSSPPKVEPPSRRPGGRRQVEADHSRRRPSR